MLIIGIDPGIKNLAFSLVDTDTKKVIKAEMYSFDKGYRDFHDFCLTWFQFQPDIIAIEKPFFIPSTLGRNIPTLEMIGIMKMAAEDCKINKIVQFSPKTIKKQITGSGKSDKEDVIKKVEELFNYKSETNHISDAIACAYTAYLSYV